MRVVRMHLGAVILCGLFSMSLPAFAEPVSIGNVVTAKSDVSVTSAVTLVSAANGARAFLSCTNTSSTVNVRWGDSTVTATKGQRIPFGASVEIKNTGDIFMVSEGAAVTMTCTEESR